MLLLKSIAYATSPKFSFVHNVAIKDQIKSKSITNQFNNIPGTYYDFYLQKL